MELKFKLNEEFEEKSPDGRDVKATVTKEGDSFILIQKAIKEGEKSTKIVHEFKGDEIVQTSSILGCDLVCTQVFKKREKKEPLSKKERYRRHYNKTKAEKKFECEFCQENFTKKSNKVCIFFTYLHQTKTLLYYDCSSLSSLESPKLAWHYHQT